MVKQMLFGNWSIPVYDNRSITKASTLIERINENINKPNIHWRQAGYEFYYRGESNIDYPHPLQPMIERESESYEDENMMLTDLMIRHPNHFLQHTPVFSHWALAQHHGLPTRLLDVTKNPLVALFFACLGPIQENGAYITGRVTGFRIPKELVKPFNSDSISIVSNFARLSSDEQKILMSEVDKRVGKNGKWCIESEEVNDPSIREVVEHLYELIREEKPRFKEKIDAKDLLSIFAVRPQQSFDRIRLQSGAFLISAQEFRYQNKESQIEGKSYGIFDYHVDGSKKKDIMVELELVNITHESLFPSLEASAKAIKKTRSK